MMIAAVVFPPPSPPCHPPPLVRFPQIVTPHAHACHATIRPPLRILIPDAPTLFRWQSRMDLGPDSTVSAARPARPRLRPRPALVMLRRMEPSTARLHRIGAPR